MKLTLKTNHNCISNHIILSPSPWLPLSDLYFQRVVVERREKLGEQLEEARKLRQSIFRRGDLVFSILARCRKSLYFLIFT